MLHGWSQGYCDSATGHLRCRPVRNEHTFLAWTRTALALVVAELAIIQLLPPFPGVPWGRHVIGVLALWASRGPTCERTVAPPPDLRKLDG